MIKSVKLETSPVDETRQYFLATDEDGNELNVPLDPNNRHYVEIRNWYDSQKKKPFEFEFEKPE